MVGRIIETEADVAEGAAHLAAIEPRFAAGAGADRAAAAAAAGRRLRDAVLGDRQPAGLDRRGERDLGPARGDRRDRAGRAARRQDEALRAAGLSRQKIAYGRAIAGGGLDFAALRALPDAEIVAALTRIKGIGVWTAEIYAMFSLGRADVFAPGDLALQEAAARLFELAARPRERELRDDGRGLVAVAGGGGAAALGLLPGRDRAGGGAVIARRISNG